MDTGVMDPFQRAVEDGRRRLSQVEGKQVSVSELLRRAGFPESATNEGLSLKGARYHLDVRQNQVRKGGHRVPAELVDRLATVLPIGRDDLGRAANLAAGFTERIDTGRADLPVVLARYLGDDGVTDEEKQETTAELLRIIAEQQARLGRTQ